MANELDAIDLSNLSIDKVKELKNSAIDRLKAAGEIPLLQSSHQNGTHTSYTNHATHSNGTGNEEPDRRGRT
jgi:hypothetical protein